MCSINRRRTDRCWVTTQSSRRRLAIYREIRALSVHLSSPSARLINPTKTLSPRTAKNSQSPQHLQSARNSTINTRTSQAVTVLIPSDVSQKLQINLRFEGSNVKYKNYYQYTCKWMGIEISAPLKCSDTTCFQPRPNVADLPALFLEKLLAPPP